jgi:hypothetical protein
MIANKKERVIIANSIADLYKKGQKVSAKDVPLGSVIIVETPEDDEFLYQMVTVYRTGKTLVRAASDYYGQVEDDIRIAPNEQVVVLTAVVESSSGRKISREERFEQVLRLRSEVKDRTSHAIIITPEKKWLVSHLRHDKSGLPTSAWVVGAAWRIRIKNGDFFCGQNKTPIASVDKYRVIYLPKHITDRRWRYDQVLEWAEENVPTDAGVFFEFPKSEPKPVSQIEQEAATMRREVQTLSRYAVLISEKAEHYLKDIIHDEDRNFVSGVQVQFGTKVRIFHGSFRIESEDSVQVFKVDSYQMIYIPEHVRKSDRRYEQVIDWATEVVPAEFRVTKQIPKEGE